MATLPKTEGPLARFAGRSAEYTGSTWAFILALTVVVVWAATGPLFRYSDTWQLVINTGTTVVTFLMVFLIQRAQNKDSKAIHLKLNELVAAVEGASNRLINVEGLTEDEIRELHEHYCKLVELSRTDPRPTDAHSVEEATARHVHKKAATAKSGGHRERRAETEAGPRPEKTTTGG